MTCRMKIDDPENGLLRDPLTKKLAEQRDPQTGRVLKAEDILEDLCAAGFHERCKLVGYERQGIDAERPPGM